MLSSHDCSYFFLFRSKYFPQHHILKHTKSPFPLVLKTIENNSYSLFYIIVYADLLEGR